MSAIDTHGRREINHQLGLAGINIRLHKGNFTLCLASERGDGAPDKLSSTETAYQDVMMQ